MRVALPEILAEQPRSGIFSAVRFVGELGSWDNDRRIGGSWKLPIKPQAGQTCIFKVVDLYLRRRARSQPDGALAALWPPDAMDAVVVYNFNTINPELTSIVRV